MALKINGVEPAEIKFVKNGVTTYLGVLQCQHDNSVTVVWVKKHNLVVWVSESTSEYDKVTLTIKRIRSLKPGASLGTLSNSDNIYYGDVLEIQASVYNYDYYCLNIYSVDEKNYASGEVVTHTVVHDLKIEMGRTVYEEPVITCVVESSGNTRNYTVTIKNPNNVYCEMSYEIYYNKGNFLEKDTVAVAPFETITCTGSFESSSAGMLIIAESSKAKQGDYYVSNRRTTAKFNGYEEEDTSTTTTTT